MLSRRDFLATSAIAGTEIQGGRSERRRPNVVLFLADDLGCRDLSLFGTPGLQTPQIDSLAHGGANFTNWYAAAPVCAPSRAALLTGRYPLRAGVPTNGLALPQRERTIANCLKEAGYTTAITGKWHLGSDPSSVPNARGFDRFFGFHAGCIDYFSHRFYWGEPKTVNYHDLWSDRTEVFEDGEYSTELFAREAVNFIRENHDRPFFLYVPFNGVHYPMHAPRRYVERFAKEEPETRMYAAMLSAVDDAVGRVLRTLDEFGLRQNTLTIFTADNGMTREKRAGLHGQVPTAGKNGAFRGFKFSAFDGGLHPPMIMNWPDTIAPKQTIAELGCHIDLLPTTCAIAGIEPPQDRTIDGVNALPLATDKARSRHPALYFASGDQLAIRKGKWKLVENGIPYDGSPEGSKPLTGDDALFLSDLEADPSELRNLRHNNPTLLDQMQTEAAKWLNDVKQN